MRKINEMLKKLDAVDSLWHLNEKMLKKLDALDSLWHLNEKSSDIICELKAKNAVLERDNELLINTLMLKGDTEVIIYRGKRYKIMDRLVKDTPNDIETLDVNCIITIEEGI